MQEKFSNSHMVQNSEQKILAVLNFMHPVEEFRAFFIDDLLTRAKNCLNMAVKDDDKALMLNKSIRKSDEITDPVLDPQNLIFFGRLVFERDFIAESDKPKMAKTMFDLTLGYALVFRLQMDFKLCHNLLKQAITNLSLMDDHLAELVEDEAILSDFFSSKLLQCLTSMLDLSAEHLSDRQKLVLELVTKVVKLQERVFLEFEKDIPLTIEWHKTLKMTIKMFKVIE